MKRLYTHYKGMKASFQADKILVLMENKNNTDETLIFLSDSDSPFHCSEKFDLVDQKLKECLRRGEMVPETDSRPSCGGSIIGSEPQPKSNAARRKTANQAREEICRKLRETAREFGQEAVTPATIIGAIGLESPVYGHQYVQCPTVFQLTLGNVSWKVARFFEEV